MQQTPKAPSPKKRRLWVLLISFLLAAFLLLLASSDARNVRARVVIEAGSALSADLFFEDAQSASPLQTDLSSIDTTVPGEYPVVVRTRMRAVTSVLAVVDTTAPAAQARPLQVFLGDLPEPAEFVASVQDLSEVTVRYKDAPDAEHAGENTGSVLLTDAFGNETTLPVHLTVIADTLAPVISGVQDHTLYTVDLFDPLSGVAVSDDYDTSPSLAVDTGDLDITRAGVYTIRYTAADFSGNLSAETARVTVIADTLAPVISGVQDHTLYIGRPFDLLSGVTVSDDHDPSPSLAVEDSALDPNTPGEYTVVYTAADFSGNLSRETARVTVVEDTVAPTISGVHNYTLYKNEPLDYLSPVSVSDDHDPSPSLAVEDSALDLSTPGEYEVEFTAADFSGNIVSALSRITVLDDTTPPVIVGVQDHGVYLGRSVDYTTGVTAQDERDPAPSLTIDDSALDLNAPGEYTVVYTAADDFGNVATAVSRIVVKADTAPPVISGVQDHEVFVGDSLDYISGVTAFDACDGALSVTVDDSGVDLGSYNTCYVTYTATDSSGNTATEKARIRVRLDTKAPAIEGAQDITVELGGTVSYRKGVTVTDNRDANPTLTIDNSAVDLNKEGRYKAHYTAVDSSGNSRTVTIRVTVTRKQLDDDDIDLLWPYVDRILSQIITDDMTDMEKAFKIYGWCRCNIRYSGSSDKSHWVMGAYDAFTDHAGDCYNYFAAGKALLTRAGIANIDIIKNENQYSRHFWSLIDVGGGWYHFDSCPFSAGDDDFFMLTDAELLHWDRTHRGAHPYDSELYPVRATESVQHLLNYKKYEVKD